MEKHREIYENFAAHCGRVMYKGREHLVMPDQLMPYFRAHRMVYKAIEHKHSNDNTPVDLGQFYEDDQRRNIKLELFSEDNIKQLGWNALLALRDVVFSPMYRQIVPHIIPAIRQAGMAEPPDSNSGDLLFIHIGTKEFVGATWQPDEELERSVGCIYGFSFDDKPNGMLLLIPGQ